MTLFNVHDTIDHWFETLLNNFKDHGTTDFEFKINTQTLLNANRGLTASRLIDAFNKEGVDVRVDDTYPIIHCRLNIHNLNKTTEQTTRVLLAMRERQSP
jgi:hypothetical protein